MTSWFTAPGHVVAGVAVKAALMYGTALLGLRVAHRRTLAQWTAIDFAAAVAVGAIVGRTAIARDQSYLEGAVALVTILVAHALATYARFRRWPAKLVDHRVRVLVDHGRIRPDQLRVCGVTRHDLVAQLRQRGIFDLSAVRYVLYEAKGDLTVVTDGPADDPPLVREGLDAADGRPPAGDTGTG
jgi:uncharacterized membrane protein YcaP (DUF421 family)